MSKRPLPRVIVNNDFYNIFQVKPPVSDEDVLRAVDGVMGDGSQVDVVSLLVDRSHSQTLISREILGMYAHPDVDPCIGNLEALKQAGKDPWGMVVSRAHERGIGVWASVRLNDTHYKDQAFHYWVEPFYYDNLHHRVKGDGGIVPCDRNNTEFDYRKSTVRTHYLEMIQTTLEAYDVDGVELDFTRNCKFFPDSNAEECAPVMTEFVKQVRALVDAAGRKRGRELVLAVITPYSVYGSKLKGVDLVAMARLGYLDLVTFSTPFLAETSRDVHDCVQKLEGVPVYVGCDRNVEYPGRPLPKEAYRALMANALANGARGAYLYNMMHLTMRLTDAPEALKQAGGGSLEVHDRELLSEVGSLQTLAYKNKLYLAGKMGQGADRPGRHVPVKIEANGEVSVLLDVLDDVGKASREGRIKRVLVQVISSDCADYNNYTVKLNGIDLARQYAFMPYARKPDGRFIFSEPENKMGEVDLARVRRHAARAVDLHRGTNVVTIKSWGTAMTVSDVEIALIYE